VLQYASRMVETILNNNLVEVIQVITTVGVILTCLCGVFIVKVASEHNL
jgi:hypothetical protein